VGGQRHGAGDRNDEEQQQELVEQKQLNAAVARQIVAGADECAHLQQVGVPAERLTGHRRECDGDTERDHQRHDRHQDDRQQDRPIPRQIEELLPHERPDSRHRHRSPFTVGVFET
jgi:hypothetical protein